jgi:hypothetical protein
VYWDRSSHSPELKDKAAPTFLDTARAKVLSVGGKHYAVPHALSGENSRKVDLDALLDVTNNTGDPAILHSKDITSVTPAEVQRSGDGWKIVKKGSVVYGKPKAEAPAEEAPKVATPQELYQKQTDAFNAYKALAHLLSTDPKRVAAWDAYQAAKAEFQKAAEKHGAPPEKPKGKPAPRKGENWLTKPFRTKAEADEFAAERPGTWVEPVTIDGKPAGYHVKFDPTVGPKPPEAPAKVTYSVVPAQDGFEVHDSTGVNHGYFSSKEGANNKIAELEKGAQPPSRGTGPETLPPTETPPTTGEGEPGVGGPAEPDNALHRHAEAEKIVQEYHDALPRGIRVSKLSGQSVPLTRVAPDKIPGGGIGARFTKSTGALDIVYAPEVVADTLDIATENQITLGKTPEEARAIALSAFERGMAGEAGHIREIIISGANVDKDRERVWKELNPRIKALMPEVYNWTGPKHFRDIVMAAEFQRMRFQLAHGIIPEEADFEPEAWAKLLPFLQEPETPWIEARLRAMDDLTKQDTELPFRSDDLNELYQFHAKKEDLSDSEAQQAVLEDALDGYDTVEEAVAAVDTAPPDYVHTTGTDHELSLDAFREAVELAKEQENDPKPVVIAPKPQIVSKVPRRPPTVPKEIGGPGPISDTDISQAEVIPSHEGSGDLGHEYIQMPNGDQIAVTYMLVDSRMVVDNPENEQPDASFKETQDYLLQTTGERTDNKPGYDRRFPFTKDPSFLQGPGVAVFVEGRYMKLGGHRRHYRDLIERAKYEEELPKRIEAFGINKQFVKDMQDAGGWPYLMAVVDDILEPEQEAAIGRVLNTTLEQPKIEEFEAISAARQLTPETLDTAGHLFERDLNKPPLTALKEAAAEDLVNAMFKDGALRETDRSKFIADNGGFTEQGAKFARLVLVGHIIDDVETLQLVNKTKALNKMINGLASLMTMKRRGQDMTKFTAMLKMEQERAKLGIKPIQYLQDLEQNLFDRRYLDIEAIFEWFHSFETPQAKKAFQKAVNDYFPLEKGAEDLMSQNIDLGEGLIRDKNLKTLSMMQPGKFGGMTAEERVLQALKKKEDSGKKLTPAEHDLRLKYEKKLGQKLLIDPNKTPRKLQESEDEFPLDEKPPEPKRAVLGGQSELDILAPGIDKSGQQTLFMQKPKLMAVPQPPKYPPTVTGEPFSEHIQKRDQYWDQLKNWASQIPENAPIVFTNPERPNNVSVVTPVVPRTETALESKVPGALIRPTKAGQWRTTTFHRPMVPQLTDQMVMKMQPGDWTPSGHDEHDSRIDAVLSATRLYPKYSPEVLFMAKPVKGAKQTDSLPGMDNLPEIVWKEGAIQEPEEGEEPPGEGEHVIRHWDGLSKSTGVSYSISEVQPSVFAIHFFNPEGGGADAIGEQSTFNDAKKAAETHLAMWKADNKNRPNRRESYKLEGPKAKESKDQGELFTGEKVEKPTGEKSKPVSLVMNRSGMTQKSRVQFLPERFKKIMKPHQQWGANLALWAFDGGTGFLNNDGPGAGKTVQQLAVGQVMANTKALPYDPEKNNYSKENGLSPKRRPLKQGMVHATLIVTENERIVHNAFAKDAEMLGIDAWRYRGDEVKPDRVYLATYNDVRSGLVKKGTFRTIIFDEAQGLRNAGYETAQALAGSDLSSVAQHVMYATATPFDKPEQIVYLAPLVGDAAVQEVYGSLGITWKRSVNPETGEVDIRFKYPDNITAQDIERVKEAIFDELTRNGKMISRNVPMDNVEVNFVEVPISDEAFIHADAMYRRIYEGVKVKSAQNAGGVAGMTVRAYLENQKIPAVIKKVQESTKKGNQVIVFASRIKEGTAGSYQQGIEGTLDKIHASLEKIYGKNTIGRVYGGDNKRSLRDIDRFQRNEIKVMLGTPNSAGTGINLDDIHGGVPRDLIIVTAPLSAIEGIQNIGRVNRLTTKSKAHVEFLFVDHPVDTWNIDIFAHKLVTLSAMVSGDLKNLKPLSQRTAEIKLNDDAVAVMTVFKREPQFQRIMRQMRTGEPGYISEQEARERLQSPNEAVRKDAQDKADKFFKDIQDETDRQRNNANQMSEDEIMELVDDPAKFSALSPGHAYLQHELEQFVKENTIFPTHAEMIRALAAQMKGEFLQRIDFASNPRMKALGTGGGTYGGRGSLTLQRGKKKARHNAILSNDKGKVFLHEFGHVAYFVLLTVPERRAVARLYAKLGGRSGTQAYFVQGTPQASTSKSRYYSNNVYEFFAESFAQYLYDKRVPGEILARLHDRVIAQYKRNFEMMRRRKDITRESGLLAIYEKGLDLKKEAKHIDYSYPDRSSLLLSTNPPKGLSRRETELWLRHKASIYNSLAGIRPQVLKPPAQGAAKFSTVQEYVTPRARPLPSGTEAIAPYAGQLALTGQKLPKSMGGAITPGQDRPIATETEKGGNVKHHFYILPRKGGGYALYQRTIGVPGQNMWTLYQRTGSLRKAPYDEVIGELRRTLLAGAGQGSRSVWHPYTPPEGEEAPPETMGMQQPRGKKKYASEITSAEGVGVRGEGGEVGEGASLRQPGEIARQGETQKGQGEIATGRGGGVPLRYDPSFKQPQPVSDEKLAAALTSNKAPLVGANRTLPKGTPVSVRIDIPSFLRSGTYAQTVHAPKLGKNIGYDSIVRLDGPVSFTVREGTSAKIRDQLISKAPIAAAEGKYNPDRALPSDINDLSKWTPLGFDPLEHSYFYDKTNDEPVVRADEAISVGNTVYVRNPVHGSRLEFLYMQAPKTPVTAFKSGANTDSIIDAYRNTKSNIGVDIQSAQPRHITKLADYAQAGGKVFVDSGAFGVKRRGGTVDFDKVFEKYSSLVEQSGNSAGNLSLVMPDVLGEQDTTLKLLDHYQAEIKKFIASGARAILPAQNGKLSLSEQYAHYKEKFGPNIAIGIPSNMDATPKQDVLRFFKQSQPTSVHLLGLGETKPNDKYLRALKLVSPRTQLSIDATWHRARVGQSRPITEKRADLKLDKADYTELFAEVFHDKWTPENPKEIKALAESFTFGGPAPVAAIAKAIKEGRLPEYLEHEAAFGDDNALLHAMDKYSMKLAELRYGRDLTREAIEHVVRTEDPNDPSRIGIPNEFTLGMLSPAQRKKLRGVFATVSKGSGLDWAKGALSDVAGLAPTSKGGMHLQAANDVREFLGERNRQAEIAKRKIQPSFPAKGGSWRMFVKMGADRTDIPYEYHPGTEFAHAMSTGKPVRPRGTIPSMVTPAGRKLEAALLARGHTQEEVNKMTPDQALDILYPPELDAAAKLYKELLDDRIRQAERADAPLSSVKQHYFPGYWTVQSRRAFNQAIDEILTDKEKEKFDANNTSEAKMAEIRARVKELIAQNSDKGSDQGWMSAFAKHPLKGPEKFRHEMVFTDKLTAEKFGLEPTMPNPADAIMAKLHELDQSIMANKIIQRWTEEGNMKIIPPTAKPPDGWREFPDPFGKVWAKSADYGLNLVGKRIVPNEYADIIENYLSDSLYESRYFGKPFGAWMAFANLLNQTQLGIGSAFHAGFTSMEAQISGLARLLQEVYGVMRGNRTMGDLGSVLKEQPTAMYSVPKAGDAVLNAYVSKTPSQDPRINQVVRAAELAGAGVSIEKGLRTDQIDAAYKDFYSGRKIRAAVRSPVALIELMAKPIMDFLVPRQKLGVFAHEAWRIIDMNPGKTLEELAPQFSMLWTTIDARLGQVQYKRLFGNNVAKNVLQMFVRAPGWTGGTILQLGGAVKDAGNFFKEWHDTGSLPKDLPPRTAYAISLVLMTAVMNAALTYLFSGKKPEGQDYWAFRTGREDEHGNPERFVLPTYMKDLYAYGKHPGETIMNKTHPAISLFGEIIKNRDYYGVQVRDPDASVIKQAYQSGKHIISAFQPFWWRGSQRAKERGKGFPEKVLPLVGVMPAPRALTQTPAQAELDAYYKTHNPQEGITPEQFEIQKGKRDLVSKLRRGEAPDITKAINTGVIHPRDISQLYKRARLGPIASAVDRLPLAEAEKVYALAEPREREQMTSILERKRAGSYRRGGGRTMFTGF